MTSFAVALANGPALLLADEPTGELDATTADRVLELLHAHTAAGGAVVGWPRNASITLQKKQLGKTNFIRIPVEANPYRRGS